MGVINCPQQGGFHLSQQILTGYTYTLGLSVGGVVTGSSHGNYHATVDPMITSDPSVANAGLYSLSLSDGIGAAAKPEPSSWLLIGAGLVALQAKRFRRFRI
jgi:hypothetical protein